MKKILLIVLLLAMAIVSIYADGKTTTEIVYGPKLEFLRSWCSKASASSEYEYKDLTYAVVRMDYWMSNPREFGSNTEAFFMRAYNDEYSGIESYAQFRMRVEEGATYPNVLAMVEEFMRETGTSSVTAIAMMLDNCFGCKISHMACLLKVIHITDSITGTNIASPPEDAPYKDGY